MELLDFNPRMVPDNDDVARLSPGTWGFGGSGIPYSKCERQRRKWRRRKFHGRKLFRKMLRGEDRWIFLSPSYRSEQRLPIWMEPWAQPEHLPVKEDMLSHDLELWFAKIFKNTRTFREQNDTENKTFAIHWRKERLAAEKNREKKISKGNGWI